MKRILTGALLLILIIGGCLAWKAHCEKRPRLIVEPCFDNRGRWYTRQ